MFSVTVFTALLGSGFHQWTLAAISVGQSVLVSSPIWGQDQISITVRQLRIFWCGAPSLTRGLICRLQLLLALASAVILRLESRGTHDHILLPQIRDSPNLEGQEQGGPVMPAGTGFPFRCLLRPAGLRCRYSNPPSHGLSPLMSWVEFYITTDGQPASLSWYKAPIWGLRPDLYYVYDSYGLLLVGRPLWREDFIYAAGPCQRNLSLVRVPWISRPYFTVSHLRLPFSSPPTTRRVTVEVFDPASTLSLNRSWSSSYSLRTAHTENTASNTYSIVACYTAITQQWLFLWLHSSCFVQTEINGTYNKTHLFPFCLEVEIP
jgi:hypothetical protein